MNNMIHKFLESRSNSELLLNKKQLQRKRSLDGANRVKQFPGLPGEDGKSQKFLKNGKLVKR